MAALAASLDVAPVGTSGAYEPDKFIAAIKRHHDKLMDLQEKLSQQAADQRRAGAELLQREKDIAFREAQVAGREALIDLAYPPTSETRVRRWFFGG